MSKPKPSTLTILFIVVVAALLGLQVSEQAYGQQWKIAFESGREGDTDIYLVPVHKDGVFRSLLKDFTTLLPTPQGFGIKRSSSRCLSTQIRMITLPQASGVLSDRAH